jgi:uncharacterized surface protein with fasciclin (FAS1) repeats
MTRFIPRRLMPAAILIIAALSGAAGCKQPDSSARQNAATPPAATTPAAMPPPSTQTATTPAKVTATGNILAIANADGGFTTLIAAVDAAGLRTALDGPGPITLFAPTDAAFAALPPGTVTNLLKPENKAQLTRILTHHVVAEPAPSAALAGRTSTSTTLAGDTVSINGMSGVMVNDARVTRPDIMASNGIIHVIDKVLIPAGMILPE